MLAFVALVVVIEHFGLLSTQTQTQITTDVIVDGASVAGNKSTGYDMSAMNDVAAFLASQNNINGSLIDYDISASEELDQNGNKTGNILVYAEITSARELFIPIYSSLNDRISITANALVRVEPTTDANGFITQSFADNPTVLPPFVTSSPGHRNPAYVTWFIEYYLNPESNSIYNAPEEERNDNLFIFDYMVCMGFSPHMLPNTVDGFVGYFENNANGWSDVSDLKAAIEIANEGKPVVIIQKNIENGGIIMSVAVPTNGPLTTGEIATAQVGKESWNYRAIDLNKSTDQYIVKIYTTE